MEFDFRMEEPYRRMRSKLGVALIEMKDKKHLFLELGLIA